MEWRPDLTAQWFLEHLWSQPTFPAFWAYRTASPTKYTRVCFQRETLRALFKWRAGRALLVSVHDILPITLAGEETSDGEGRRGRWRKKKKKQLRYSEICKLNYLGHPPAPNLEHEITSVTMAAGKDILFKTFPVPYETHKGRERYFVHLILFSFFWWII